MSPVAQFVSAHARLEHFQENYPPTTTVSGELPRARWRGIAVLGALLLAVLAIQAWLGAYGGERGNYSDEAAHFMNGVLVRDYLTNGLGQNPVSFAEQFYLNAPKIAPLVWPPLFHTALGIALLPGWQPHVVALVLLALATAWTAWRIYSIVGKFETPLIALLSAGLFVLTPAVIDMTTAVMLDIVVAAFAVEATCWLVAFVQTRRRKHAMLFGLFCACACLTKGNGISVVLVPFFLIALLRRPVLFRASGLYLAAAVVAVLAIPFLIIAYRFDASIGDFAAVSLTDVVGRSKFYGSYLLQQLGPLAFAVALIGAARSAKTPDETIWGAALTALLLGALVFHIANPHRVVNGRYIVMAIAPLIALIPVGVSGLKALRPRARWASNLRALLLATVALTFLAMKPAMAVREPLGFRGVAALLERRGLDQRRTLVVSDENGEGAFVSEIASRRPMGSTTVVRGSKLLASGDWGGNHFRMRFASADKLMQELEDLQIEYLVLDTSAEPRPYRAQVDELLTRFPTRLERVGTINQRRDVIVYRLKYRSAGNPKELRIDVNLPFGKVL